MKIHFGFLENYGDYESPAYGCEEVVCGCHGEMSIENATSDWDEVTCKKCLRLKEKVIEGERRDNEKAVKQLGDMADFFKNQEA